jgi:hypothetical protein
MPIDIRWADEAQSAIIIQPNGKWSWEDFYNSTTDAFGLLDSAGGSHTIHTILDWTHTATWPMNTMVHGKNLLNRQHSRQGAFVFTGMNAILNGLFQVFMRLNGKALQETTVLTAKTVDEALTKLAELPNANA